MTEGTGNLFFTTSRGRVSLSGTGPIDYDSGSGVIGFITGNDGQILAMSGSQIVWKNPDMAANLVTSVFGRTGAVIAQGGDYTTSEVTEGTNLYFTDARAQNALSGTLLVFSSDIASLSGTINAINTNLTNLSGNFATLSGIVSILGGDLMSLSGNLSSLSGTVNTINTNISNLTTEVNTLSGQVSTNITNIGSLS
jgi:hypothetical protein